MQNEKAFFDYIRVDPVLFPKGELTQSQVEGIQAIIAKCKAQNCSLGMTANILATAGWESGHAYVPVEEKGRGAGRPYGVPAGPYGLVYYGRGLVQITWLSNYRLASERVGVDLVRYPHRALEPEIALTLLVDGMLQGWYTGKKLGDFIDG